MKFEKPFLSVAFATGAFVSVCPNTLAQEIGATARLDPVIVTATHSETPLSDLPMSVSVIGDDALAFARAYNGAEDLTDLVTGVEAAVANGTQVAFQIRGIGAVDHQALTPTAAAVYSDGVYLATNVQTGLMLYDLERIEVLKGPQGTLYGRNASGGAVNLVSVRPGSDQSRYVRAGYGNFNRFGLSGAYGEAFSNGVSYRIAGNYLSRDAALDNVGGPEDAGGVRDEFGLRAGLAFERDHGTFLLRAHYEEDNGVNATPRNDSLVVDDHEISSGGDGLQDTDNEFYGASAEYDGTRGAWDVFSLTAVEGYNQDYGFDFDGAVDPFGDPALNANLSYDRDFVQVSQELRLSREMGWGRMLIGASATHETFEQRYTIWCGDLDPATLLGTCRYVGAPGRVGPTPASNGTATTLVTDMEQDRTAFAVFTYNEVELSERLSLTLGARLTNEQIDGAGQGYHIFDDGIWALNNRDGLGAATGENTIDDTRLSGNAALAYAIDAGTFYASVSNSYKSGGFNGEVANNVTHYEDAGLFDAETVTAYEVGFKATPTEKLRYSIAAFYQDYDAPQARIFVSFPLPDGTSITSNSLSNLDEAVSFGLEAEFAWQVLEAFGIEGALTLNETEIEQSSDIGGNAALFDGNSLPFAPDVSATFGGRYGFILTRGISGEASVHAKYRGDYYLDPEGLESRMQEAFTTVQAQIDFLFEDSGVELSVWGRNLTDEDYALSGYGFIGYNTFRSDPRTFGVRFGYEF